MRADYCLLRFERAPGKTDARSPVVLVGELDVVPSQFFHGGDPAGMEVEDRSLGAGLAGLLLDIVAKPDVDGQRGVDLEIVLRKKSAIPGAVIEAAAKRAVGEAIRLAEKQACQRAAGGTR